MPTITYLDEIGQQFVDQCMKFVNHNSYDRKSYIKVAHELEDSIFEREWCIEVDGSQWRGVSSFDPNEMWYISESWWESYDDLETTEEQKYVKNYIKDVFPDVWRP